jgi:hypothetical protein
MRFWDFLAGSYAGATLRSATTVAHGFSRLFVEILVEYCERIQDVSHRQLAVHLKGVRREQQELHPVSVK